MTISNTSYRLENQAAKLNNYIQILHYVINEMEQGEYKVTKDRTPTLDDELARVIQTSLFILEGLKEIRKDIYTIWEDLG